MATWAGVACVCFIVDAFSRMIVGWRITGHMRTPMILDAIEMPRWNRGLRQVCSINSCRLGLTERL